MDFFLVSKLFILFKYFIFLFFTFLFIQVSFLYFPLRNLPFRFFFIVKYLFIIIEHQINSEILVCIFYQIIKISLMIFNTIILYFIYCWEFLEIVISRLLFIYIHFILSAIFLRNCQAYFLLFKTFFAYCLLNWKLFQLDFL